MSGRGKSNAFVCDDDVLFQLAEKVTSDRKGEILLAERKIRSSRVEIYEIHGDLVLQMRCTSAGFPHMTTSTGPPLSLHCRELENSSNNFLSTVFYFYTFRRVEKKTTKVFPKKKGLLNQIVPLKYYICLNLLF